MTVCILAQERIGTRMAEEEVWRVVLVAEEGKVWIDLAGEMLLMIRVVAGGGELTSGSCCRSSSSSSRDGSCGSQRRLGSYGSVV
jgi:hypothetical protein